MEREVHANKYSWLVLVFTKYERHWFCHSSRQHVLTRSTLFSPRVLCKALSQVGPEFHALSRSKLL